MVRGFFMNQYRLAYIVLRYGLAIVLVWFGISQILDNAAWVGFVPIWTHSVLFLEPTSVILINGFFEVVTGVLLGLRLFVRPVAFVVAVNFALITFEIGLTAIGLRDFGLTAAALALALFPSPKEYALQSPPSPSPSPSSHDTPSR